MPMYDMDLSVFHNQFRDETIENLRVLNTGLMALLSQELSAEERRAQIDTIFRAMHTIKGSARMLGFEEAGKVAHTCEHILGFIREGRQVLDRELADALLSGGDAILELVQASMEHRAPASFIADTTALLEQFVAQRSPALEKPIPQEIGLSVERPKPPPQRVTHQTIRVRVDRLDTLLNLTGELAIAQKIDGAHFHTLDMLQPVLEMQQRAFKMLEQELRGLRFSALQRAALDARLDELRDCHAELTTRLRTEIEHYGTHIDQANTLMEDLEIEVLAMRLMPISTLMANLPRAAQSLAKEVGKEVTLVIEGETTELDRKVIEALNDPLMHLLRNAIDHGIEKPEERVSLGKPAQGNVRVQAEIDGAFVKISLSDDGRGIDLQRIRQIALRQQLLAPQAIEQMTDQEVLDLIFVPGFSTAQQITDISGRGVGMDVVRTNVMEIGGQVLVESQPGMGTTFILSLPLMLVTTHVIQIEVGAHTFMLPANNCQSNIWVLPEYIQYVDGRTKYTYSEQIIPLVRLADLLDIPADQPFPPVRYAPAMIIGTEQRPIALVVDKIVDELEVVIKPLGPLLERERHYNGVAQLDDGTLTLLLNPVMLAQTAGTYTLTADPYTPSVVSRRHRLLIADDSFATRELFRSILQSAGYDVSMAVDGLDALDKLRADSYDLVLSDVEMPRIDGFQLVSSIREEFGEQAPPVIIITSLASESYRQRGLDVGAHGYIVKSQFNQGNLLEAVRRLLKVS